MTGHHKFQEEWKNSVQKRSTWCHQGHFVVLGYWSQQNKWRVKEKYICTHVVSRRYKGVIFNRRSRWHMLLMVPVLNGPKYNRSDTFPDNSWSIIHRTTASLKMDSPSVSLKPKISTGKKNSIQTKTNAFFTYARAHTHMWLCNFSQKLIGD